MKDNGFIYILTNPSFPEYIKIGYAGDVDKRVKDLNRSECIPFAFRIYATYEVPTSLSDKEVHKIIDGLNPGLRSIETYQGKERKREFYALSPEVALGMLESMAAIHGVKDKIDIKELSETEKEEEEVAAEVRTKRVSIRKPQMSHLIKWGVITIGTDFYIKNHKSEVATLISEKEVNYKGRKMNYMEWGRIVLGYPNFNFYDYAIECSTDKSLSDLRLKYMIENDISIKENFNE